MEKEKYKIYAMVPARIGSTRLKFKNIRLLHKKPLIWYGLNAAQESGLFDKVYINTDEIGLKKLADEYNSEFYHRKSMYATSSSTADDVIYDFFMNNDCDILFWINTTNPFQPSHQYKEALNIFLEQNLDGLITTTKDKIHTRFKNKPLNFNENDKLPKTQDLEPVEIFAFPFSIWRKESFIKNYEENGYAYLCGNIGYFEVDKIAAIEIDNEEDFLLASYILYGKDNSEATVKEYADLD